MEVISYTMNLSKTELSIKVKCHKTNSFFTLIFSDVLLHHFEDEYCGSIILDFEEYEGKKIYEEYQNKLENDDKFFHLTCFNDEDFFKKLKDKSYFGYFISASYGFNGLVVSKKVKIIED